MKRKQMTLALSLFTAATLIAGPNLVSAHGGGHHGGGHHGGGHHMGHHGGGHHHHAGSHHHMHHHEHHHQGEHKGVHHGEGYEFKRGDYVWHGVHYNYFYNGAYYNNCNWVEGHYVKGVWVVAKVVCY